MDLSRIRFLCEKREGGMKKLASDIGMSEANLHRCVNNNKIQAADLEKISSVLNVPVSSFFSGDHSVSLSNAHNNQINGTGAHDNTHVVTADNAVLEERIKSLEALLQEKERLIQILINK